MTNLRNSSGWQSNQLQLNDQQHKALNQIRSKIHRLPDGDVRRNRNGDYRF